jgi:hypothetical protein
MTMALVSAAEDGGDVLSGHAVQVQVDLLRAVRSRAAAPGAAERPAPAGGRQGAGRVQRRERPAS